jgi:hypothetical protein
MGTQGAERIRSRTFSPDYLGTQETARIPLDGLGLLTGPLAGHRQSELPLTISRLLEGTKVDTTLRINRLPGEGEVLVQGRFLDRALRTVREYHEKVEYLHLNPEKARLVRWPEGERIGTRVASNECESLWSKCERIREWHCDGRGARAQYINP